MRNKPVAFFTLSLIFFSFTVSGQKMINSPFSRFNLGSIEPAGSFRSIAMGGTGTAMRDNNSIFFSNPASYSSIDTNSFIFDFGIDYGINILSNGTTRHSSEDLDFDHLIMGFPITKGFGIATGLVSFSNGYYKIAHQILKGDPEYDSVTGEYTTYHSGEGGLTNVFIGSGLNITKNISAGMNMTFLFGNLDRSNEFIFSDYYNVFHNTTTESLNLSGLNFDYGIQYNAVIKKDYFITAGASLSTGKYYKSSWETLSVRFNAYNTTDTLSHDTENTIRAYLPGTLRLGLSLGKKNKFTAGLDYISTKWSEAKIEGADGYLADTRVNPVWCRIHPGQIFKLQLP